MCPRRRFVPNFKITKTIRQLGSVQTLEKFSLRKPLPAFSFEGSSLQQRSVFTSFRFWNPPQKVRPKGVLMLRVCSCQEQSKSKVKLCLNKASILRVLPSYEIHGRLGSRKRLFTSHPNFWSSPQLFPLIFSLRFPLHGCLAFPWEVWEEVLNFSFSYDSLQLPFYLSFALMFLNCLKWKK